MRFSQRNGYTSIRQIIQKESMDNALRNGIWSVLYTYIWNRIEYGRNQSPLVKNSNISGLLNSYWLNIFKEPIDIMPDYTKDSLQIIRKYFFDCDWHEVYSFVEETLIHFPFNLNKTQEAFIQTIDNVLKNENSAYRLVGNQVIQITSEQEIQSIEEALTNTSPYSGVKQHLNQAFQHMSDRQNPDYRNSIKDSISAVESICRVVTGNDKASLGQALKIIETKYGLHEALKKSLSQLYGYTSDGDGIRHAMIEVSNLTYIDAKFMLVACTNFINYLIEKTKE